MSKAWDGGMIALAVVIAAYVLSFFHRFVPAGIAGDLAATFLTSAASRGVLAATRFHVYTIMQVPTGALVDTLGPRRILVGSLSDRICRRKPVLFGSGVMVCGFWVLLLSAANLPPALSHALFALMGMATAGFVLTWACAKEVNPPQLSGMSTSVTNMGGFLAGALIQPAVGMVMDLGWDGTVIAGVRQYDEQAFLLGIGLIAALALLGTVASLFVRETGCRNIWRKGTA